MNVKVTIEYFITLTGEDEEDIKDGNLSLSDIDWSYYIDGPNEALEALFVSAEEV